MPIQSASRSHRRHLISVAVVSCLSTSAMNAMAQATEEVKQLTEVAVIGTAEDEVKQSLAGC